METRHNFSVLSQISPPLSIRDKLKYCIIFEYKSLRNFSRITNISHTTLLLWLRQPDKYPEANHKIIHALGFDPFNDQDSMAKDSHVTQQ